MTNTIAGGVPIIILRGWRRRRRYKSRLIGHVETFIIYIVRGPYVTEIPDDTSLKHEDVHGPVPVHRIYTVIING